MPLKNITSTRHPGPEGAPQRIRHPFFAFVKKEAIHILRDRWTTLILLGLPVLMLVLFGFAISTEIKNTGLFILDPSTDPSTRAITEKLRANDYFSVSGRLEEPEEIEKTFRRGQAGMVVVFSNGFHESLIRGEGAQIQLLVDGSDPNAATTLVQYATNIIMDYLRQFSADRDISPGIEPEIKLLYNPGMRGAYQFVPGVMGMVLMLICAMMTSIAITREKELGSMEVLLASPVKPLTIILAKTVPYFFLSLINLSTILLISVFIMEVPVKGSLLLLILISLLFIFVSLSLGLLISSLVKKQLSALLISGMALMVPVIFLSGMMFPTESMPWVLRALSQLIPAKWYITAVKDVMIKGSGFFSVWREALVLSAMGIVFIGLSLKNFKVRLG